MYRRLTGGVVIAGSLLLGLCGCDSQADRARSAADPLVQQQVASLTSGLQQYRGDSTAAVTAKLRLGEFGDQQVSVHTDGTGPTTDETQPVQQTFLTAINESDSGVQVDVLIVGRVQTSNFVGGQDQSNYFSCGRIRRTSEAQVTTAFATCPPNRKAFTGAAVQVDWKMREA